MKQKIIEYVLNQINLDLEQYRTDFTRQFERTDEIIIEYKEIPRNSYRNLELLCYKPESKLNMEDVGVFGKMICFR